MICSRQAVASGDTPSVCSHSGCLRGIRCAAKNNHRPFALRVAISLPGPIRRLRGSPLVRRFDGVRLFDRLELSDRSLSVALCTYRRPFVCLARVLRCVLESPTSRFSDDFVASSHPVVKTNWSAVSTNISPEYLEARRSCHPSVCSGPEKSSTTFFWQTQMSRSREKNS